MRRLPKAKPGDKVAIVSPSFCAPAVYPHVYQLGLARLKTVFQLEPVSYPSTVEPSSAQARAADLIAAFQSPDIKAVIATIGGNDQVTYIQHMSSESFRMNPKPFLGYSDCTHFCNFLWVNGIPSFYGGAIMTQFAMNGPDMDSYTVEYLRHALFSPDGTEVQLGASEVFNEVGLDWALEQNLDKRREYRPNTGWIWDVPGAAVKVEGISWGGCLESIDELLVHDVPIPTLEQFKNIVLFIETSEEIPSLDKVRQVYEELGRRGILAASRGFLVGRAKAWEFDKQNSEVERDSYRNEQYQLIRSVIRRFNNEAPIVLNLDFGHTDPQMPFPYGKLVKICAESKQIAVTF